VESTLRGIAGKYATERDGEAGVLASIALAKCLLRERKYKESQAAIDRAELLRRSLKTDAWPELAREIAIVRARALAGRGDSAGALRSLRAVIAEAKSQGFYGFELQARLAAGEVELKSGRRTAVRQELLALADEARVRGFGLIARAAGQAGRPVLH
jgi:tetratricopeptide (TPR) repeat protein